MTKKGETKFSSDYTKMVTPPCKTCKHLAREAMGMRCLAFPDGIPAPILLGKHDHKTEYPGDGGVRYEKL